MSDSQLGLYELVLTDAFVYFNVLFYIPYIFYFLSLCGSYSGTISINIASRDSFKHNLLKIHYY